MAATLRSGPDDDLAIPWERLADGRVWRLKHGRDFNVDAKALTNAAEAAALRLGKIACVMSESIPHPRYMTDYVWIQFVDHEVMVGSPCPCGSHELIRVHPQFAHCPNCAARLKLSTPRQEEKFADNVPGTGWAKAFARGKYRSGHDERFALEEYSNVLFVSSERRPRREKLYGTAVDPLDMPVLVWVAYPLSDGSRTSYDGEESGKLTSVQRWPVPPFSSMIDLDRLPDSADTSGSGALSTFEGRGGYRSGRLDQLAKVALLYQEDLPGRERFYGHALERDGSPVLIYVDYPLLGGARIRDPNDRDSELHAVYRWPVEPFGPMIDLSSLSN